jgi:prolyl-tRNA editing enzyme YbaK/EbsC (Cys-tRNA(Pro) deacylase)
MALVSGANRLDVHKLGALAGGTISRADADAVRLATGFAIGGVAPLGSTSPIRTFLDEDLLAFDVVWAAAGTPSTVFAVAPHELARATGSAIADLGE